MQLAGELSKISLSSLIQLLRNGELTGKICLTQGASTAFMFVDMGKIIHVETDTYYGRDALLELFLWVTGSFSFIESAVGDVPPTLATDEPIEKILKEGIAYLDQKKFLDQLRVNSRSVLSAQASDNGSDNRLLAILDGVTPLGDLGRQLGMTRRELIEASYRALSEGKATAVELPVVSTGEGVELPAWVISRLQQDNPDISQAIVELVIWADRVKCWMYQADADLDSVISQLSEVGGAATAPQLPVDVSGAGTERE